MPLELTERLAATLGHVVESSRHRSSCGHHPHAVRDELLRSGLMVVHHWKKGLGPVYEVTPLGLEVYREYEQAQQQAPVG